jgi:5-methyltetrahydropteroyltriglutamate--homocysteine methyltransferase
MKGMLTGPVTILNWSFVRNDVPRSRVAKQIAQALSGEVADLQKTGIKIIQVDEAAFREGYPLRKENKAEYEQWALEAFRLAVSTADMTTQIHTHMCYSEFYDIIKTIEAMDADVLTIETARSGNKLLKVFKETAYQSEIGPGVYDIHSPRIPSVDEFKDQISTRLEVIDKYSMWVNPDCGLKTRTWEEVRPAIKNMVEAATVIRGKV